MRREGVEVGDRVCGYLPNIAETVIAMLATTAIGGVWCSCATDIGTGAAIDRLGQVNPRVLVTTDGYYYKGKVFDVTENAAVIAKGIPSVKKVIVAHYAGNEENIARIEALGEVSWNPSNDHPTPEEFRDALVDVDVCFCCWGVPPEEIKPGKLFTGYRTVLLVFNGEVDFELKLKAYLRLRFKADPAQAAAVTVNPWGCGKFRTLVNKEFLLDEIRASAETGASHYQIDDGWQAGGPLFDLVILNRKLNNDFWSVSDMLGGKLDELMAEFSKCGLEPSLWVAPSCNTEFRDYKDFEEMILAYYRKHDIRVFKVDGVKMRTYESEENLRNMLHDIRTRSNGEIVFNLDTTNGQRAGYFLFLEYGNIFLENRYVCHYWGVGYHPERTLRNFWKLARYIRSEMLQIEVANPGGHQS